MIKKPLYGKLKEQRRQPLLLTDLRRNKNELYGKIPQGTRYRKKDLEVTATSEELGAKIRCKEQK